MDLSDVVSQNYWQSRWTSDDIFFHRLEPNEHLIAHKDVLPDASNCDCRLFIPLCGKTVDIVYLENFGYDVYGCEFVEKAILDFFEEHKLTYTKSKLSEDVFAYKANTKNITIYQGDFFALNSKLIGKFNAVWDRGSLIAIDPSRRNEYAELMNDLLAPNCKYLLYSVVVGGDLYKGPPHTLHDDEVKNLFGSVCGIELLEKKDASFNRPNAESYTFTMILLTKIG